MRLIKVKLTKFKRFALNAIESFVFEPKERVQLILGTNGSGKTSFLRELLPSPPNPANYKKGAVIEKHYEHQSFNYVLRSTMSGGAGKHSFQRAPIGSDDFEELNPGGTVTVQKELVKQHFKLTDELCNMLLGKDRFTRMSPGRRRDWLTRLSEVDYTYAIGLYDKLREQLRDTTGAMKRTSRTLVTESSKLMSQADAERLVAEIDDLHGQLEKLHAIQAPLLRDAGFYRNRANELTESLTKLTRGLMAATHELVPLQRGLPTDDLDGFERTLAADLAVVQNQMDTAYTEFKALEDTIEILKQASAKDIERLRGDVVIIDTTIGELQNSLRVVSGDDDTLDAATLRASSFTGCYEALLEIVNNIPDNSDKRLSSANLQALRDQQTTLQNTNHQMAKDRDALISECRQMEYHKTHSRLECPKCRYGWAPSYNEDVYQVKQTKIAELSATISKNEEFIRTVLAAKFEEFESFRKYYSDLTRLTRSYPQFGDLWDLVVDTIAVSARTVLLTLNDYQEDLGALLKIATLRKQREDLTKLIEQAVAVGDANLDDSIQKLNVLEKAIVGLQNRRGYLASQSALVATVRRLQNRMDDYSQQCRSTMEAIESNSRTAVDAEMRRIIKEAIRTIQTDLALKTDALAQHKLQQNYVDELLKTMDSLTVEESALKLLVKELSPNEGLIADGLLGFIRIFTAQMNKVIRRICSYPLEIQPCGFDSDNGAELNYRFPFKLLDNDSDPIPDIGDSSAGQEEIINLAFRIVSMQYLGFKDYPLILDEFGAALDAEHRNNANHAIQAIMEQCSFSQLYMVSHYESSYGFFKAVDICVLDPRNITVPAVHNQHVTIN